MIDSKTLISKLQRIKLLVMDVDGTLTDGKVYYSAEGEAMKRFSIRDGMGIELLRKSGIESAILTSEISKIVESRAKKLKIEYVLLGSRNKKQSLVDLCEKLALNLNEIAYIGDDVNDLDAMLIAGVTACPSDAVQSVTAKADYICTNSGGNEAVREFAEKILMSQNKSINLPENW